MGTKTAKYEGIALRPTKEKQYYMVGESQSFAYAHYPGGSASGIRNLETAIERLCEGGYVVDKRGVSSDTAIEMAFTGPMDEVSLPPMTMKIPFERLRTFTSYEEFAAYESDLLVQGRNLSMHCLSLDLYAEWCRRKGAKVGRKVRGEIQWKAPYSGPLFERTKGKENNV